MPKKQRIERLKRTIGKMAKLNEEKSNSFEELKTTVSLSDEWTQKISELIDKNEKIKKKIRDSDKRQKKKFKKLKQKSNDEINSLKKEVMSLKDSMTPKVSLQKPIIEGSSQSICTINQCLTNIQTIYHTVIQICPRGFYRNLIVFLNRIKQSSEVCLFSLNRIAENIYNDNIIQNCINNHCKRFHFTSEMFCLECGLPKQAHMMDNYGEIITVNEFCTC